VLVCSIKENELPKCGLACSLGLTRFGVIFISRHVFYDLRISEELKRFIIGHELAHIVRGHQILNAFRMKMGELLEETLKARREKIADIFSGIIDFMFRLIAATAIIGLDIQIVRQEELEADKLSIELTGCKGALEFAEMLNSLKERLNMDISHESFLGIPALTLSERTNAIRALCG